MKRKIAAGLAVVAVVAGVGWTLANHSETSAGLENVRLIERSERSNPGPTDELAGIRIRLSPSDSDGQMRAKESDVPHIALATE